jgi:CheY-like chemotaxis protein
VTGPNKNVAAFNQTERTRSNDLIEDSRFLRIAIERILVKAGHSATDIADGLEGLRAARTNPPALILSDMMLPGLDGTGVLKALKQDASTAQIPVIVLTGLAQKNEEKLKNAGAAAYIEKSSLNFEQNPGLLIQSVECVLRRSVAVSGSTQCSRADRRSCGCSAFKIQTTRL